MSLGERLLHNFRKRRTAADAQTEAVQWNENPRLSYKSERREFLVECKCT
jgi:hypothetical protein